MMAYVDLDKMSMGEIKQYVQDLEGNCSERDILRLIEKEAMVAPSYKFGIILSEKSFPHDRPYLGIHINRPIILGIPEWRVDLLIKDRWSDGEYIQRNGIAFYVADQRGAWKCSCKTFVESQNACGHIKLVKQWLEKGEEVLDLVYEDWKLLF